MRQLAAQALWCAGLGASVGGPARAAVAPPAPTAAVPDVAGAAVAVSDAGFIDKTIGEIPASGIVFKDIVKVDRVSDPKVCLCRCDPRAPPSPDDRRTHADRSKAYSST